MAGRGLLIAILSLVADPSLIVPMITASGTLGAAALTGFGAATLKRRWDEQAEERRWRRERAERRRDELKSAFTRYLTSRTSLRDTVLKFQFDVGQDWVRAASDHELATNELMLLLDNEQVQAVERDHRVVRRWTGEALRETLKPREDAPVPDVTDLPNADEVIVLAKRILRD